MERTAAVTVRETVSDTLLKQAGQVVAIDLAVGDLAGKIYAAEKAEAARGAQVHPRR